MNRNTKEKISRIEIRARPKDKARIQSLARQCNLSLSEYMIKRALGYEPRAAPPDAFYHFYNTLCTISNHNLSPQVEKQLLALIEDIHSEFILQGKEPKKMWQQQDSGQSKTD